MPHFQIVTLAKGRNFYEVDAPTAADAEAEVYAYLEGNTSSAKCVGDDFDVESIQSVTEVSSK